MEGLQAIGPSAFYGCRELRQMRVPSTVNSISEGAFALCKNMTEVELCEGLLEIGASAFYECLSLNNVTVPSTVKRIGYRTFCGAPLFSIRLPDIIESIGESAFSGDKFLHQFRIPPLITAASKRIFYICSSLFSLELPENATDIGAFAFAGCHFLRNVAVSSNADIGWNSFQSCKELQRLFGSEAQIINSLKHRFDGLPIHKLIYYHSYDPETLDRLNAATYMRSGQRTRALRSKSDPTGNQQDCLGMTPLHILACSTVQNMDLYRMIVENYPENIITEDKWGTLPLFYALWGNAPSEVVQFLVERCQSIYPNHELNWSKMVETLGRANEPSEVIQRVLDLQESSFPGHSIEWESVIDKLAMTWGEGYVTRETFIFFVESSVRKRLNAIGVKLWRDDIANRIHNMRSTGYELGTRTASLATIRAKLAHYEAECHNLKEATSMLELALWKAKINELSQAKESPQQKKLKLDEPGFRNQCRIRCGSHVVVEHVFPYLYP